MRGIISKIPVLYCLIGNLAVFFGVSKPLNRNRTIVIAGGYGNRNVGDEAQLAFNLTFLQRNYPEYTPVVLSPDPEYTWNTHAVRSEYAPRVTFFRSNATNHYGRSDFRFKLMFFLNAPRLLLNARLAYAKLPLFWVYPGEARLLDTLNNAHLLLLSGGGYLTGATLSRLWDNALLIRLAHAMNVPAVASGQTIGVFRGQVSRTVARWGLKKLRYITVRDKDTSLNELASIGITGQHVASTFDDALFCEVAGKKRMDTLLRENNISPDKPYVVINIHYWGQKPDLAAAVGEKMVRFCDFLSEKRGVNIVLLPMHPTDEQSCTDLISRARSENIRLFSYPYDYRDARGLIKYSQCCITMKHHPIVFACGEAVPVMSMVFDEYYAHKNRGALALFGMEGYVITYDEEYFEKNMIDMYDKIDAHHDEIVCKMKKKLEEYRPDVGICITKIVQSCTKKRAHA